MRSYRGINRVFAALIIVLGGLSACVSPATPTPVSSPTETAAPPPTATARPVGVTQTALPATPAPPTQMDPATEIDAYLAGLTKLGGFSGVALVARGDEILLRKAYGYADRDQATPNTPETQFRIGHVTTPFVHIAFRQLEALGKLTEQDQVCGFVADCPPAWKPITLGHLLSATSGIPSFTEGREFDLFKAKPATPTELLAHFKDKALLFEPGTSTAYSTSDYVLVALAIESAAGTSFETYVQDHILIPLALTHTGFESNPEQLAVGYANWNKSLADPVDLSVTYGWGGLSSTADDLFVWAQALGTDALLPADARAKMFTARAMFPDSPMGFADGWAVFPRFGKTVAVLDGGIAGFAAEVKLIPEDQVVVILLCNQGDVETAVVGDQILSRLYPTD